MPIYDRCRRPVGKSLRYCLDQTDLTDEWPDRYSRAILPYSLFNEAVLTGADASRRSKGLLNLEPPPRFDLLIVDEAHNARNQDTNLHQRLRVLADNAEAVVLITATPVQLGTGDLFSLLNLLRPDLVIDRPTFERMATPNGAINEALAAVRQGGEGWQERHPRPSSAGSGARSSLPPTTTRACAPSRPVEGLHSFAFLINRTRDGICLQVRKPKTEPVLFTPAQMQVHDGLLATQERLFRLKHPTVPLKFMMTTLRRQAASCLHAMAPFVDQVFARGLSAAENAELEGNAEEVLAPDLAGRRTREEPAAGGSEAQPPARDRGGQGDDAQSPAAAVQHLPPHARVPRGGAEGERGARRPDPRQRRRRRAGRVRERRVRR